MFCLLRRGFPLCNASALRSPVNSDALFHVVPCASVQVRHARDNCRRQEGNCFAITVKERLKAFEGGLNVGMYRKLFRSAPQTEPNPQDAFTVAVHIRRGDVLLETDLHQVSIRMIPNVAYLGLLEKLLAALRQWDPVRALVVVLVCEGARAPADVPDYDGSFTDFGPLLRKFNAHGSLGSGDGVAAFDALCRADVLVTSQSGMSHLAAVLCPRPVVLALPFWHSYACVPRRLPLQTTKGEIEWKRRGFWGGKRLLNVTLSLDFDESAFRGLLSGSGSRAPSALCCPLMSR